MKRFQSEFGLVELTEERLGHILEYHPEVKSYLKDFTRVLRSPRMMRPSKYDREVKICYGRAGKNKWLAIVVKTNSRNFILTAYLTTKL